MAQPTVSDVKTIIDTDLSDSDISAYIEDAYDFLMAVVGSENRVVQKWVTAHLIAYSRERQIKTAEAKGTGVTYTGKYLMSLEATSYGQMAISMDITGKLSDAASKKTASLQAIQEKYN